MATGSVSMSCPHCGITFDAEREKSVQVIDETDGNNTIATIWHCPSCRKLTISMQRFARRTPASPPRSTGFQGMPGVGFEEHQVFPRTTGRPPTPPEVVNADPKLVEWYTQACLTLNDSPMASAALSRRCLQHILRDHLGAPKSNLDKEIDWIIKNNKVTPELSVQLDAVRHVGNFAAHPVKVEHSGEIADVEPDEAGWSIEVLEGLFQHVFVAPAVARARIVAMNEKLAASGKPLMDLPGGDQAEPET